MNKKNLAVIILAVLVVVLAGALGYVSLTRKPAPNPPTVAVNQQTNQPVVTTAPAPDPCADATNTKPFISSLSQTSGPIGTALEIRGCNLQGFEGDKNAWIVNDQGVKGILYGEDGSTDTDIKIILKSPLCQGDNSYSGMPCDAWLTLMPGNYKIYTEPWAEQSNQVEFTIQ
jgi:hypothetical protein